MGSADELPLQGLDGFPIDFNPDFDPDFSPKFKPSLLTNHDNFTTTMEEDTMKEVHPNIPTHPIPSMQGAFAESMLEASANSTPTFPKPNPGNAAVRRQRLLDQDISEETSRWRQKPGQRHHELWKLMAQISFGIYLLLNGIAKDDEQVMNILQGHVDEVDEFLEMTLEDFDLAQDDIDERLKFLKLPLENIHIFDAMLEDRQFRLQIVSGNEKIEHVITRTATAMKSALQDVQQGLEACKEFTFYLAEEQEDPIWREERPEMEKVYDAMKGNVEGWYKAYVSLQTKGNQLGVALVQLGSIVAEMDRRAGEISRNTRFSNSPKQSPLASPPQSPPQQQSREVRKSMRKSLPSDGSMITPAIRATLPAFQLVQERERTPEPEPQHPSPEAEHFLLAPRTYTPGPPSPQLSQVVQPDPPAPEINKRSSLRKRFSLGSGKKKDPPSEPALKPPPSINVSGAHGGPRERAYPSNENQSRRKPSNTIPEHSRTVPAPSRDNSVATPPSRGLDSAYCSDFEKPLSPPGPHPATYSDRIPTPPILTRDFPMPSPRSDQTGQYFRPVNASPNSPLQRPWTAAPSNHMHTTSNLSNLSKLSNGSTNTSRLQFSHQHTPSQLGLRDQAMSRQTGREGMKSRMGMSMVSDMTTVTEDGKKVRKKRSAFGWLKKAFALSEEEKMAFEQKRRAEPQEYDRGYYERPERRWVDGKRIR